MKEYTLEEKEKIGNQIADVLYLKKSKPYGYKTAWGTKTPVGIFETFRRINEEIENGTFEG